MKVLRLDHYGRGIVNVNNKVCFVENALKDEEVEINIKKENKKFLLGEARTISNISPERVKPKCKYYGLCGGCNLEHMSLLLQEKFKCEKIENILERTLKRKVKVEHLVKLNDYNYRNKVVLHVEKEKLGFFERKTNSLIDIDECLLLDFKINDIIKKLRDYIKNEHGIKTITIKLGNKTSEVMLIIEGSVNDHESLLKLCDVLFINDKCFSKKDYITSFIGSKKYLVRKNSFFQINYLISTAMYDEIKKHVVSASASNVLDLYCGSGTIGIYISDVVDNVIGVEVVSDAIKSAKENKEINNCKNIEFILGKVEDKIDSISNNNIDTIIVDPPRSGLHKKVINSLEKINPKTIIYVSCDPMTMARDIDLLSNNYELKSVSIYDMFPNTYHVESISLLERKSVEK